MTRLLSVAVPVPVRRLFTYSADDLPPLGARVRVPFGRRHVEGTVVAHDVAAPEGAEIKPIGRVLEESPRLPDDLLDLARFVSDYYLCSLGDAIETALPPDVEIPAERLARAVGSASDAVREQLKRATRQLSVLERLWNSELLSFNALDAKERRAVGELAKRGLARIEERRAPSALDREPIAEAEAGPTPTEAQRRVLQSLEPAIDGETFSPFLMLGETGSGKTEVYFRAAERALARGRGVIYLVPEIGLTPLLIDRVKRRFPGEAVVLHSALTPTDRLDGWRALREGRRRFAVGTRSAIFAPIANLGLIVVDEEQDGSYKQEETPRYNARDLAIVRARDHDATALLGSATPSMESFHRARTERYRLLELGGRIDDRPLASVEFIDMREEYGEAGEIRPVSTKLIEALQETVGAGEQALVLRNRRGWSIALHCPQCGERVQCERCSVSLTWHRRESRLRCHTCDFSMRRPRQCDRCGHEEMQLIGQGSEQVESILAEAIPTARIERMDRDTIRRRGAHERMVRRFAAHEIDILVGTQMIAKGHDFPNVTLVGVISADQSLGIPDFRAGERTFHLLTQVAGRAGRGKRPGKVLVQAFDPEHPILHLAAEQKFLPFYEREIAYRRALRYPPLTALVRIVTSHKDLFEARRYGDTLAEAIRKQDDRLLVLGPGPAAIERVKERYREQILVRSTGRRRLVEAVGAALDAVGSEVPARYVQVDVDPYTLL